MFSLGAATINKASPQRASAASNRELPMTAELIDLTHTFDSNMPFYPGDPAPRLEKTASIEQSGFNLYCLCSSLHVGTHMDAPLHMIGDGARVSDIHLPRFFGRGRLVDARGWTSVKSDLLDDLSLERGDIVAVLTGWYKRFRGPDYYSSFPEIAPDFATRIADAGVSILALDTPSPDREPFPVHKILLSREILIVENLNNVEALLGCGSFDVIALPTKLEGDAAPVRVIALPIIPGQGRFLISSLQRYCD
ncbi:MAG: cyclase family protein [Acetobacteraceae bacterium]|nr:cyclase family protein [Acetobacteraceae bacterium]